MTNQHRTSIRAPGGGTIGINGHFYKGGRFLPNTQAEPGRWKLGRKWIASQREPIEPGITAWQPTPFSRSIFVLLGVGTITRIDENGAITLHTPSDGIPIKCHVTGEDITLDTRITPGVKGIAGQQTYTLRELIDLYTTGARWVDVTPDCDTTITQPRQATTIPASTA